MSEEKQPTYSQNNTLIRTEGKSMEELRAAHREKMAALKQDSEKRKNDELAEKLNLRKMAIAKEQQERSKKQEYLKNQAISVANIIRQHLATLTRKYFQLTTKDDYGRVSNERWNKEKDYFINNIIYSLIPKHHFSLEKNDIEKILDDLVRCNAASFSDRELSIENLNGVDYEFLCAEILMRAGWKTSMTSATGDQGVDVIAEKNNICLALQCKKYSAPVGNSAVQEIYAGMRFVNATHGAVISNAGFTPQAQQLAKCTNVLLLHHTDLAKVYDIIASIDS